jgi:hypothetical protein
MLVYQRVITNHKSLPPLNLNTPYMIKTPHTFGSIEWMDFPGQAPADHVAEVCDGGSARGILAWGNSLGNILWMEEILHQLIDGLSHYF